MPRPTINGPVSRAAVPSAAQSRAPLTGALQGPQLLRQLRRVRSKHYLEALSKLDAGTHHQDRTALDAVLDAISNEFPELAIDQRPLGLVSRCHLGPPYEVHICDLAGSIIEHFEGFRSMPPLFERARELAKHGRYAFVEIYADRICAVSPDGAVSVIES